MDALSVWKTIHIDSNRFAGVPKLVSNQTAEGVLDLASCQWNCQ